MEKMNKYMWIWAIVLVVILGLLTTLGFMYKSKSKPYKELETKLADASKKYIDAHFLYPEDGESVKTMASVLTEENYLDELKMNDKPCEGYTLVEKENGVFQYRGYIKCEHYTTKGY